MKIVWAERDWLLGKINVVAGFETIVGEARSGQAKHASEAQLRRMRTPARPLEF